MLEPALATAPQLDDDDVEPEPSIGEHAQHARIALVTSGFDKGTARRAVASALKRVAANCTLEDLLREALGHCVSK